VVLLKQPLEGFIPASAGMKPNEQKLCSFVMPALMRESATGMAQLAKRLFSGIFMNEHD